MADNNPPGTSKPIPEKKGEGDPQTTVLLDGVEKARTPRSSASPSFLKPKPPTKPGPRRGRASSLSGASTQRDLITSGFSAPYYPELVLQCIPELVSGVREKLRKMDLSLLLWEKIPQWEKKKFCNEDWFRDCVVIPIAKSLFPHNTTNKEAPVSVDRYGFPANGRSDVVIGCRRCFLFVELKYHPLKLLFLSQREAEEARDTWPLPSDMFHQHTGQAYPAREIGWDFLEKLHIMISQDLKQIHVLHTNKYKDQQGQDKWEWKCISAFQVVQDALRQASVYAKSAEEDGVLKKFGDKVDHAQPVCMCAFGNIVVAWPVLSH